MSTPELHERLARIETRVEALPDIARRLDDIQKEVTGLRIRVAGVAATAAVVVTILGELLAQLFK